MHHRDGACSLATRCGDPLHRLCPDVARGENPCDTCDEVRWREFAGPLILRNVASGQYEAAIVERNTGGQPVAMRFGTDQQEQSACAHPLANASDGVAQLEPFELSVTTTVDDFGGCLLYTSPSPRDRQKSRMPSSA